MYESKHKNESSSRITGEVMMFFGTVAPTGWLIMDGTEYLKSDYQALAAHLASLDESLSRTDYVGSDSNHFKVPNVLGEFPRFTGTNSHANQGSGSSIGIHQDATEHHNWYLPGPSNGAPAISYTDSNNQGLKNTDSYIEYSTSTNHFAASGTLKNTWNITDKYTSRPTNTSFLPCIKY